MKKSSDFNKKVKKSYDIFSQAPREELCREDCQIEDILCYAPPFAVHRFLHTKRRDYQVLRHVNFSDYAVHFLCSGRFFLRWEGKEITMMPGEIFFEPADSCVEMGIPEGCECDRLILFLRGFLLPALARRLGLTMPMVIHPEEPEKMRLFFEDFKPLLQNETQLPQLIGKSAELLTSLAEIHGTFHKGLPDKMAWALKFIQKNLKTGFTLHELSNYLHLTQSAVKTQFQKCFNCLPLELLRQERLKRAAEMLESGGLSIKEISMQCGFSTPRYFSDAFRKAYHLSPRAYSVLHTLQMPR